MPKASSSSQNLLRKIALVTGATQGIGLAIARALADEGCNLVLSGRDQNRLRALEAELSKKKIRVLAVRCDVRDERSIAEMLAAVRKKFRRLDILVNNAGIAHANLTVGKLSAKEWNDVVATNLTGMFLVTKASLPLMKRGSVIVNNLSIAARRTFPGLAAYNASKHGALGFTNTLREELREQGIRVIATTRGDRYCDLGPPVAGSAQNKDDFSRNGSASPDKRVKDSRGKYDRRNESHAHNGNPLTWGRLGKEFELALMPGVE